MSKSKNQRLRLRLWRKNPHCYWCGIVTKWFARNPAPPDGATLDHIRSRYVPERSRREGLWRNGIIVLACWRCNNERCAMEQEYLARTRPEVLHQKNGSKPASKELLTAQSKLATAILNYVEHGGTLDDCTRGRGVRSLSRRLRRLYEQGKQARRTQDENQELAGIEVVENDARGEAEEGETVAA